MVPMRLLVPLLLVVPFALLQASAQSKTSSAAGLAATPPMGWNSWDSYGLTVTETQFKDNTNWLNAHLKQFGWQYVAVDEGWYITNPESGGKPAWSYVIDGQGRYIPAVNRFPSANAGAGFKPLADYVHSLGLKFGIHIIRGIPREAVEKNLPIAGSSFHAAEAADVNDKCRWNPDNYGLKVNAAGQAYYDSLAKMYAGWGLDFIKVDCISSPYKDDEIRMMSEALRKTGRPIAFSLSPGPTPVAKADDARKWAQMWRISDDFWDDWNSKNPSEHFPQSLSGQFQILAAWAPHVEAGHWPDADMLPIGHLGPVPGYGPVRDTKLTPDEQRTLLTLWSIARSPLILGANLTRMKDSTTSLLTNPEVIAVDQHSLGARPVITTDKTVVWVSRPRKGSGYWIGVFNVSDTEATPEYGWNQLGLTGASYRQRDLWERKDVGSAARLKVTLRPHASVLYEVTADK
jgi:alpha-galactosidase